MISLKKVYAGSNSRRAVAMLVMGNTRARPAV
jgi:hypothetical protein